MPASAYRSLVLPVLDFPRFEDARKPAELLYLNTLNRFVTE
jgi:hypothetical protein